MTIPLESIVCTKEVLHSIWSAGDIDQGSSVLKRRANEADGCPWNRHTLG